MRQAPDRSREPYRPTDIFIFEVTDWAKRAVDSGIDILNIETWTLNFDAANGRANGDFSVAGGNYGAARDIAAHALAS